MGIFNDIITEVPNYKKLKKLLSLKENVAINCPSTTAISNIITSLCADLKHRAFVVCKSESEALRLKKDINSMGMHSLFYPYRDFCFIGNETASKEYEHKRLSVLYAIANNSCDIIVTTLQAAMQATIPKDFLNKISFKLVVGENVAMEALKDKLLNCGFEPAIEVSGVGQFSIRGGIIDLFSPFSSKAYRIELFGDEIDTISELNIENQRRQNSVHEITVLPCREVLVENKIALASQIKQVQPENHKDIDLLSSGMHISSFDKFLPLIYDKDSCLLTYLEDGDLIFVNEYESCKKFYDGCANLLSEELVSLLENGEFIFDTQQFLKDISSAKKLISRNPICFVDNFLKTSYPLALSQNHNLNINTKNLPLWTGSFKDLKEDIRSYISNNYKICIFSGSERNSEKILGELVRSDIACERFSKNYSKLDIKKVLIFDDSLTESFEYIDTKTVVISYGAHKKNRKIKTAYNENAKKVSSLTQFEVEDYVVHSLYGVGIFKGIHRLETQGVTKDYIKILYAKDDILYVPVTQLDMVAKYIGSSDDKAVKLNRLSSQDWQKQKNKAKAQAKDIAKDLIKIYSKRMNAKGYAFSEDNDWQRDFELRFEYEETDDQIRTANEIKKDMESSKPMDRLLCGDVGFGKTEVAFRAAFKCVQDSKQCAFLVPTTILAWQHYKTAVERFDGFPVKIEFLSRFKTKKEQNEIIRKLERGEIDIIIGTHRLVQRDVKFKDLGLVIVDEEQRFGVLQKEKFKNMAQNVDVLTLSATPIPRTLNMALSGIRDMSSIEEAPKERMPVQSYVLEYDRMLIIEAIRKELRRGGQVYYLRNNIESLTAIAKKLTQDIPDAKLGIAHSKMTEDELSDIWQKLLDHEIDILICTTIIEAGIDVPNVNTLIIEDADKFGLSQLHQIRGRVGRSSKRAYAYFTFRRSKVLTEIAMKRLNAVKNFTEFGAGFKISMRDLEIRGAGNLLGGEQHGCMDAVGYDMYVKLLSDAFDSERGIINSDETDESDCLIDIPIQAFIPENYITDLQQRLDMYKKIAMVHNQGDAQEINSELKDRFGKIPQSITNLIDIAIVRNQASKCSIYEIRQKEDTLLLFINKIDMKVLSHLISKSENQIRFSAGTKPYLSIKLTANQNILQLIKSVLNILWVEEENVYRHNSPKQ